MAGGMPCLEHWTIRTLLGLTDFGRLGLTVHRSRRWQFAGHDWGEDRLAVLEEAAEAELRALALGGGRPLPPQASRRIIERLEQNDG